ncbi:hypothetical protein ACNIS0_24170, partial [Escherichia coli]
GHKTTQKPTRKTKKKHNTTAVKKHPHVTNASAHAPKAPLSKNQNNHRKFVLKKKCRRPKPIKVDKIKFNNQRFVKKK